ncbi:MAG: N-acetyl-gamma-glutamyl-phosphate reductase [Steroidobacteraceae bacterium]|jgi:N-acetyl-gamma-glutamyl-phosphate reductase common form
MRIPTLILGGTGYVAGELLRLILDHPHFELCGIVSDSQPGSAAAEAFSHLAPRLGDQSFMDEAGAISLVCKHPRLAILSAAPHGVSASLIDRLLNAAHQAGTQPRVVDISADYRYRSPEAYAAVYQHAHGAPARLKDFTCALPEHLAVAPTPHVAHPGCFATATLLASVPLLALGLSEPLLFVSGVTGSTGSGRKPVAGTHHPQRHSDLYSYNPLMHRHIPEITECATAASGVSAEFAFVPHSGPFARGIHVTVQGSLSSAMRGKLSPQDALVAIRQYYADAPFVTVTDNPPRLKDVVASNHARLSVATRGNTIAVMCVIDNLTKGAAGGAVQWLNRLFDLPETTGLLASAPGWT